LKYHQAHEKLSFWNDMKMEELAGELMREDRAVMESYN
jgi:hypothetical protein